MKFLRASLLVFAFLTVSLGFGFAQFGDPEPGTPTAACARCGDGQCQKSCGENATTCPRDCGGVPQTSAY